MIRSTRTNVLCACLLGGLALHIASGHTVSSFTRRVRSCGNAILDLSSHIVTLILSPSQDRHSLRSQRHVTQRRDGRGRSLRQSDNIFGLRDGGGTSSQQQDNVFTRGKDASSQHSVNSVAFSRQLVNETEYIDVEPIIRACQCDGTACAAEEKHVGDTVSICVWSNFLEIAAVVNMTLHIGSFSYQPVVNGTVNELTEVSLEGKLVVITIMTISAFFEDASPSDLEIDATVSFVPLASGGRRQLVDSTNNSLLRNSRSLEVTERSIAVFVAVCFLVTIVLLSASVGALLAKGYCCDCSTRVEYDEERTNDTYVVSK